MAFGSSRRTSNGSPRHINAWAIKNTRCRAQIHAESLKEICCLCFQLWLHPERHIPLTHTRLPFRIFHRRHSHTITLAFIHVASAIQMHLHLFRDNWFSKLQNTFIAAMLQAAHIQPGMSVSQLQIEPFIIWVIQTIKLLQG